MSIEQLSCLVSIATLVALWRFRYAEAFPWFVLTMSLAALQSIVTLVMPATSHLNRYVWAPIQVLLLGSTAMSLMEAAWKRLETMNQLPRFWCLFGVAVMPAGIVMHLRGQQSRLSDWYAQFWQHDQPWFFLWAAMAGFCCLWFAFIKAEPSASPARWHLLIYAGFLVANLLIPNLAQWRESDLQLRAAKMIASILWVLNARYLHRLIEQLGPHFSSGLPPDASRERPAPSPQSATSANREESDRTNDVPGTMRLPEKTAPPQPVSASPLASCWKR